MYINLLKYSKVPNRSVLNGRNYARQLKREYCTLTYNKDKFVIEVFAYDTNYHNGDLEDIITKELPITEGIAFELLRKYNK